MRDTCLNIDFYRVARFVRKGYVSVGVVSFRINGRGENVKGKVMVVIKERAYGNVVKCVERVRDISVDEGRAFHLMVVDVAIQGMIEGRGAIREESKVIASYYVGYVRLEDFQEGEGHDNSEAVTESEGTDFRGFLILLG